MTHYSDQLSQGRAVYARWTQWNAGNTNAMPSSAAPTDTNTLGIPHHQCIVYQIGIASTAGVATAGAVIYSATGATGGITLGTTVTFDVVRGVRIFTTVDLSTVTFTIRGTDGYGVAQAWSGAGPTGNTLGNIGSYVDSSVTFKTVITASGSGSTGTTAFSISNNNVYGLPFHLPNVGRALGCFVNGNTATIVATFTAGLTATGTPTATTADVRGTVTLPTTQLADGSRYFTVHMLAPTAGLAVGSDDKNRSYGATPFTA